MTEDEKVGKSDEVKVKAEAPGKHTESVAGGPVAEAAAAEAKVAPSEEEDIFAVDDSDATASGKAELFVVLPPKVKKEPVEEVAPVESDEEKTKKGKKRKKKRLDWVTEPNKFLYLDVYSGGKMIDQIPLGAKSRYVIGRDKGNGILMMHPSISRKHAALCHGVPPGTTEAGAGATLVDLRGGNGTFYAKSYPCRGQRKFKVTPGTGQVLKEGMCFRFGESSRSFIVRGMAGRTATTANNPNFKKEVNARDIALSNDLGLENDMKKKARKVGPTYKNPFKQASYSSNNTNLMLPTLTAAAPKPAGETTFSSHNRKKSEMANIKYQHEHLCRKRVMELKAKQRKETHAETMAAIKSEKLDD